jgi:hypothetical protein
MESDTAVVTLVARSLFAHRASQIRWARVPDERWSCLCTVGPPATGMTLLRLVETVAKSCATVSKSGDDQTSGDSRVFEPALV